MTLMPRQRPDLVLRDFDQGISQSQHLAAAAHVWILPTYGPSNPKFTTKHQNMLIELAFLKCFLAWERFLEESFILYLMGKKSPRRFAPKRFIEPPTREYAIQLVLPEGRQYANWDDPETVQSRAQRFFIKGGPYKSVLSANAYLFKELRVIRNAMVHHSSSSQGKFQGLVRQKIGALPLKMNVGTFLSTTQPNSNPPISFLDDYLNRMICAAKQIVPI